MLTLIWDVNLSKFWIADSSWWVTHSATYESALFFPLSSSSSSSSSSSWVCHMYREIFLEERHVPGTVARDVLDYAYTMLFQVSSGGKTYALLVLQPTGTVAISLLFSFHQDGREDTIMCIWNPNNSMQISCVRNQPQWPQSRWSVHNNLPNNK